MGFSESDTNGATASFAETYTLRFVLIDDSFLISQVFVADNILKRFPSITENALL